jgi:hypothetical protein
MVFLYRATTAFSDAINRCAYLRLFVVTKWGCIGEGVKAASGCQAGMSEIVLLQYASSTSSTRTPARGRVDSSQRHT